MPAPDPTRPPRPGEELDVASVGDWLRANIDGAGGSVEVSQFPSGASNLTYLLRVGDRELVLRRPPPGRKAKTAHDMSREVRILEALRAHYPYVPEVLGFCRDPSVLGCDFYVMERIEGLILRRNLPKGMRLDRHQVALLCRAVVDRLIDLHAIDPGAANLGDFGRPEGYVRRQVEGWSRRYVDARTPNAPSYERVMEWLAAKQPGESGACVIHGDYRFDNVVLDPDDPTRVVGVLDWEMATVGDPLMDLGNSLAYWIGRRDPLLLRITRVQPTHLAGMMSREDVVRYYGERTGTEVERFDFYRICGVFRLVVIMQQIYYRYYHGQSRNRRFGRFIWLIKYLEGYLERAIRRSPL